MDVPGSLLTPALRLERVLRSGERGDLWLVENTALGTPLGLQLLTPRFSADAESVELLMWNARSAGTIRSPYLLAVVGSGISSAGKAPYVLHEAPPALSLRAWIEARGPLSLSQTARLVHQLASMLAAARAAGVVHRALHPESIFLEPDGDDLIVRVLPFDITLQRPAPVGMLGAPLDAARYLSPELLLSPQDVDARADLWSLAANAYLAITGAAPFDAETTSLLLSQVDRAAFVAPSTLRAGLSPEIDAWFQQALCHDIDGRFGAAEAMDRAFQAASGQAAAERLPRVLREPPSTSSLLVASREKPELELEDDYPLPRRRRSNGPLAVFAVLLGAAAAFGLFFLPRLHDLREVPAPPELAAAASPVLPIEQPEVNPDTFVGPPSSVFLSDSAPASSVAAPASAAAPAHAPLVSARQAAEPDAPPYDDIEHPYEPGGPSHAASAPLTEPTPAPRSSADRPSSWLDRL